MHKRYWGLSSILMAGVLAVSSVNVGAMNVNAAAADGVTLDAEAEVTQGNSEATEEVEVTPEETKEAETEEAKEIDSEAVETKVLDAEEDKADDAADAADEEVDEDAPVFTGRWNQSLSVKGKLTFSQQYEEFVYDLGEDIPVEEVNKISVKVKNQGNNVCIKLYSELSSEGEKSADYSANGKEEYTYTPSFEGSVRYVGVMSMPEGEENYPYSITVTDISVDRKEADPSQNKNEETLVFEGEDLKFTERWDNVPVEGRTLEYDKEWREYYLSLGKTIPGEDVKSIKFVFAEPTKKLCFKVYGAGEEITQVYGQSGKAAYTYIPSAMSDVDEVAIMAMNEQEYPFDVTVERIEVVVDTTPAEERPQAGVEYDIVDLREPVEALMGEDFIIGTAVSYDEFRDANDLALTTKHFNGVTLGNELKPDAMLKASAEITTQELNGEDIAFPVLDFSTPEGRLDYFLDWNEKHPEKKIRIRGHVLVWHSQTPDFFFHEDYDTSKPYVTPDVMNKRLEVYIREVAHHFTAPGSKYAGMFYGWDVVNEAVSDGTGTYRNASENSTWWRVYQSEEFINNAFVYANRYMPEDIALFYNDYNDTTPSKVEGICKLIENVKATPGARIDGFGMQAHYQAASNNPTMEQFKEAARKYAKLVDQIQVTELDFKGGTSAKDERIAERYKAVYDTIRRLRNEGINFTGMTIWGVTDKHSWLQTSNSVGGSADGRTRQYPLLFDDYYKAKNAFWAIANAGELEPEIRSITIVQNVNDDFSVADAYELGEGDSKATFSPLWDEDGISVKVTVNDATVDATDSFTIFTEDGTGIKPTTVKRADATATDAGYESVVRIKLDTEALNANKVKLDVTFTDGDKSFAFGDTTFKQAESSKYFAETVIKPLLAVAKGTAVVDGEVEDAWKNAVEITPSIVSGAKASAKAKLMWDEEYLYVLADVKDAVLNKDASDAWEQDSVEVFIDENNGKTSSYQDDDKQYRIGYENALSFNGTKCLEENMKSTAVVTEDGYRIEAAFKWTDIEAKKSSTVGFDIQINDADESGKRAGTINWADNSGNGWSSTEVFGTIVLTDVVTKPEEDPGKTPEEDPTEKPAETVEAAKTVEAPEGLTLTYNGSEQTGVKEGEGFTLTGNKATDAGTYTAVATLKEGHVWKDGSTTEKKIEWKIKKAANTLTVKGKTATLKASKLKKKAQKISASKLVKTKDAKGDVTFKKVSGSKKITVNKKTGKVTVKKGLKKGTYKVKVEVQAAGDKNFEAASQEVTIKIKVKK